MSKVESVKKLFVTTVLGVCLGALIGLVYGYFTTAPFRLSVVWWSAAIGALRLSAGLSAAASNDRPEWRIWSTLLVLGAIGAVVLEVYREPQLLEFLKMMDHNVYFEHIALGAAVGALCGRFPFAHVLPQVRMRPNVPDDVKPYVDRAQAFEKNDEYDEAIKIYQEAISIFPDSPVVHNNLGCALANLERYDDAQHHFERAIVLTKRNRQQNLIVPSSYPEIPEKNLRSLRSCVKSKGRR